jgi:hypothetical protein
VALESLDDELDLERELVGSTVPLDLAAELSDASDIESDDANFDELPISHRSWPAFVGMTSELIDRGQGGLFERLRAEKGALVDAGVVTVEAKVQEVDSPAADAGVIAPVIESPGAESVAKEEMSVPPAAPALSVVVVNDAPDHGLDLVALRDRLLESEDAAREVAELLEATVSRGTSDPALLRALGEAYLKLGKSEQAASQFRRAMLARRRAQ